MHVNPNKRYADASTFRRALEQARPKVSWWTSSPATGVGWEGVDSGGTTWRAAIEPKAKGEFRFAVEKRLRGKAWRKQSADALDAVTEAAAVAHAHQILDRIAVDGR